MRTRTNTAETGGRTLVVTGDDFGLTHGVNRGIVYAHLHGILTHTSLIATAPFVAEAIDLALRIAGGLEDDVRQPAASILSGTKRDGTDTQGRDTCCES